MEENERERQSDPDCVSHLLGLALSASTVVSEQQWNFTVCEFQCFLFMVGPTQPVQHR